MTAVLSGLGGVGKTQLVAEYWRTWCAGPGAEGLALWIAANSRGAILTAYAEAAASVAEPNDRVPNDPAGAAAWFLTWLAETGHAWLIVLDDISSPAEIRGLWPEGPAGACVVTTRRSDAVLRARSRQMVRIGLFDPNQSFAYLSDKLAEISVDADATLAEAHELAEDLQHLPLALAQAAAFIADRPGESCATYRVRLADQRRHIRDLFPQDATADDYEYTVAAVWELSVDAADRLSPAGVARPLLELASLLDTHGIPLEVLTSTAAVGYVAECHDRSGGNRSRGIKAQDCRDGLANLARLCVTTIDLSAGPRAVRTHGLVQRATRDHTSAPIAVACAASDALLEVWTEDPHDPAVAQTFRDNAASVITLSAKHLWAAGRPHLLFHVGHSLSESGQALLARDYWQDLARTTAGYVGPDSRDVLAARQESAFQRGVAGDPHGARDELMRVLSDTIRSLGAHHRDTRACRQNIAHFSGMTGDADGAVRAYTDLLEYDRRHLDPTDARILITRYQRASWQGEAGDPEKARDELRMLLFEQAKVLDDDDLRVLTTRANVAYWQGRAGDHHGALAATEEVLRDQQRVLGPTDRQVLTTRHSRACWLGETGAPAEAVRALTELLGEQQRLLGDDHPDTAKTSETLSYWHERSQQLDPK